MKDLKEKKANQLEEKATPAKWKKIRERAGELAMNQGKRSDDVGEEEMQRAKRELLDLKITSPKGGMAGRLTPEGNVDGQLVEGSEAEEAGRSLL